ncbi:MAG TPA: hypothetical protein VEY91_10980, partial [Candidatus Limnocylindria bacterium]|nr:hypothetical protein [Candidatus Limnocylindria bacterium]
DRLTLRLQDLLAGSGEAAVALLIGVAVVLAGWMVATLFARLTLLLLRLLHFNPAMRRVLDVGGRQEPAAIVAWAIHWTILAIAVMLAADILGFHLTASVGERLRELLPRVVSATIVLACGIAIAMLMGGIARSAFSSAGFRGGRWRGQVVTAVLTGFAVLLALEQLGLAAQFIIAVGITAVAAVGLAVGLSFGLGCRDLARDFVVEYLRSSDEDRSSS